MTTPSGRNAEVVQPQGTILQNRRRPNWHKKNQSLRSLLPIFVICLVVIWLNSTLAEGLLASSGRSILASTLRCRPSWIRRRLQQESFDDDDEDDYDDDDHPPEFHPQYTGIYRELTWELANRPIPLSTELALLRSGVLWRPGEFNRLQGERVQEMQEKCKELGMTLEQGLLIRKQLAVTKVMRNTWKLTEQYNSIVHKFCKQRRTLFELSKELELPPVNILRTIVRERVDAAYPDLLYSDRKQIVKSIINEDNSELVDTFLNSWEIQQLQTAKEFDVIGYSSSASEIESSKWEQAIYTFLDEHNINYLTEDDMRSAGSRITPDCLLLDNCIINGREVRWIDAKNFYGSGLRESGGIVKSMGKQILKYEAEFGGSGAIVFKRGFSQKFIRTFPSTLFLDAGPLRLEALDS